MSHSAGDIFIHDDKYLCWQPTNEAKSSTFDGVTLQSAVQSLSTRSLERMNDERHSGRKHARVELTQIGHGSPNCSSALLRSHSRLQLTQDTSVSVWKKDNRSFLISYETWDAVKYLQVSNVDGYVAACGGFLFIPSILQTSGRERHLLTFLVYNSLWTNGRDVLNNAGASSVERYDALDADVPSIELNSTSPIDGVSPWPAWRARIEKVLHQSAVDSIDEYEECKLRIKRREYILRRSLEIVNECGNI